MSAESSPVFCDTISVICSMTALSGGDCASSTCAVPPSRITRLSMPVFASMSVSISDSAVIFSVSFASALDASDVAACVDALSVAVAAGPCDATELRAAGADVVFAWENAKIGAMDAKAAGKILAAGQDAAAMRKAAASYEELQNSPASAAARGCVDTIISEADTRKFVIGAFEMLYSKREERPDKKHGTI